MPLPDHPSDHMDDHHKHGGSGDVSHAVSALIRDVAVLSTRVGDTREDTDRRLKMQERAVDIALLAADKTTQIAQQTADKAVVKAEAAASREYLESQIKGLAEVAAANLSSQKEALNAALIAAKDALVQAQENSDKAIAKAEEASEVRFAGVNEFRKTLSDQASEFANKSEIVFRFSAMEEKLHVVMTALSEAKGKSQGSNWLWGVLLGTGGIILTLITAVTLVLTRTGPATISEHTARNIQQNSEIIQRLEQRLNSLPRQPTP